MALNKTLATGVSKLSQRITPLSPALPLQVTGTTPVSWRDGLRSLYCRMLARSISNCLFGASPGTVSIMLDGEQAGRPSLDGSLLPTSWLQVGTKPEEAQVARLKAAIVERFGVVDLASIAPRAKGSRGQSLIYDKAA